MAVLKSRRDSPPGEWKYFQRETEYEMKGENESDIVNLVVAHRRYRNLHPQDPEAVRLDIHRQICSKLGTQECQKEGPDDKWKPINPERIRFTASMIMSFSAAALEFVKGGLKLVPVEESLRRAAICQGCPMNQPMTGCNCNNFHKIVASMVPADRTIPYVGVCYACGCDLKSKVNLTDEVIIESNKGRDIEYPDFCWQRAILEKAKSVSTP